MRSDQDLEKWNTWKRNPTSKNLSDLTKQMKPILYKAIQINMGSLSPAIIGAEAKIQAKKAFVSFDPTRGVKLSTHVTNYMQKVNRINYKHQEIFNVPEARRIKHSTFSSARESLQDRFGRPANVSELSDHLGWSTAEVKRFNKEDIREFSDTQPYSSDLGTSGDIRDTMTAYVYHGLNPMHKSVMEHTMGYNGVRSLSNTAIKKKLNITQGQLSYAKGKITKELKTAFGEV